MVREYVKSEGRNQLNWKKCFAEKLWMPEIISLFRQHKREVSSVAITHNNVLYR